MHLNHITLIIKLFNKYKNAIFVDESPRDA